jgi:acyl-homoserine lactone acylase PvdQ
VEDLITARLAPEMRSFLQRYGDGVNRFLLDVRAGANGATLPPAYALLGVSAQDIAPWVVEDTIAIGRLQTFQGLRIGLSHNARGAPRRSDLPLLGGAIHELPFRRSPARARWT